MNTSNKPSVAIVKSRLYRGGVFQVIQELIHVLNEQGIVPDIVTMKSDIESTKIGKEYNSNVKFNIRKVLWNITLPYEWHFLYFNLFSKSIVKEYDFIIDSNNTSFLSYKHRHKLIYVHYPRKERSLLDIESIHFPEGKKKSIRNIAMDPFRLSSLLYRFDKSIGLDSNVLANSLFTRDAIVRNYSIAPGAIQVLYPPIEIGKEQPVLRSKSNVVVSLGRFSAEKRQLEQIEIASKLPEFKFYIIGFATGEIYLNQCKERIAQLGLTNVFLMANAPKDEIEQVMDKASFFLHNVRNEPFGITTVQGISRGLIPVVHDSGGQKEIVFSKDLRFGNAAEAIHKIGNLAKESEGMLKQRSEELFSHCQKYSVEQFRKTAAKILDQSINGNV